MVSPPICNLQVSATSLATTTVESIIFIFKFSYTDRNPINNASKYLLAFNCPTQFLLSAHFR